MSEAADPGAAGARHGRRARQLLQRYLVVFGPIHGAERARADGAGVAPDPLAQLVVDFFAGRIPSPAGVASAQRLTAELASESPAAQPPESAAWGRFDRVCARLGIGGSEADALLLLVAPVLDAGTRWLVRALFGEDGWRADRLRCVLEPLAGVTTPVWAAASGSSRLVRYGLVIADGDRLSPSPALLAYLCSDRDTIGAGDTRSAAECAVDAERAVVLRESMARLGDALATARAVVVRADASAGVACLAAWACHRHGVEMVELAAAELVELTARAPGALVIATAIRGRGLLLHGVPAARQLDLLARVGELGLPVVVHVARDTPLLAIAGLSRALAAPVVEAAAATVEERRQWWASALASTPLGRDEELAVELAVEPLGPDALARAVAAATLASAGDIASGIRLACRELAPTALYDAADRITGPMMGPIGGSGDIAAAVAELRAQLARGQARGLVFVRHGQLPLAPIANLIARELGLRAFEVTASRVLQQPAVPRWLAGVLAAAATARAALVVSDLSAVLAGAGGDAGLIVSLLREHDGVVFVSASERTYFTSALDERAAQGPLS